MEPTREPGDAGRREETTEGRQDRPPTGGGTQQTSKRFSERSPEEVRQAARDMVRRGVASLAGALEGLNSEVEEEHLPEKAEQAIHNIGETTRKFAGAAKEETRQTRDALKGAMHEVAQSTREMAATAKQETRETREAMKGTGHGLGGSTRQLGSAATQAEKPRGSPGSEAESERGPAPYSRPSAGKRF
jgi:hypothetical protein